MMENVFVLIILFILLVISLLFVSFIQAGERQHKIREMQEIELIKKAKVINFLPEVQCSEINSINFQCYDTLKIEVFQKKIRDNLFYYKGILGNINLSVARFDPSPDTNRFVAFWNIYDNPKEEYKGALTLEYPIRLWNATSRESYFGIIYLMVYE